MSEQEWKRFRVQVAEFDPDDPDNPSFEDIWVMVPDARAAHDYIEEQYSNVTVLEVFTESGEKCKY